MWKSIVGYEGLYDVSEDGKVFSHYTHKELKHAIKRDGYHQVTLVDCDKKLHYKNVHVLVAETFIPKIDGKNYVNHKDGNKDNNCVSNLEWCTSRENMLHSIYTLGKHKVPVNQLTKSGKFIKLWDSIIEASKGTGVRAEHIWRNAQKIRPSAGGFVFEYAGWTRGKNHAK